MVNIQAKYEVIDASSAPLDKITKETTKAAVASKALATQQDVLGDSMRRLGGSIAALFSIQQVTKFVNDSTKAFLEAERATRAVNFAFGDNSKSILELTDSIESLTAQDGDLIAQTAAQLKLFGRSDVEIKRLTKTAADLAGAGIMPVDQAMRALSQTYDGNTRELGRQFASIKELTDQQLANGEAVKLISERVKGMGAIYAASAEGGVELLRLRTEKLQEELGENFLPMMYSVMGTVKSLTEEVAKHSDTWKALQGPVEGVGQVAKWTAGFLGELADTAGWVVGGFEGIANAGAGAVQSTYDLASKNDVLYNVMNKLNIPTARSIKEWEDWTKKTQEAEAAAESMNRTVLGLQQGGAEYRAKASLASFKQRAEEERQEAERKKAESRSRSEEEIQYIISFGRRMTLEEAKILNARRSEQRRNAAETFRARSEERNAIITFEREIHTVLLEQENEYQRKKAAIIGESSARQLDRDRQQRAEDQQKEQEAQELRKNTIVNAAQFTANSIFQISQAVAAARTAEAMAGLEMQQKEIKGSAASARAKEKEMEKLDKKRKQIEYQQALRNWKTQQASIAVNASIGVGKTIAEMGLPAAFTMIPFILGEAAVAAGVLAANKPKAYATGTAYTSGGMARVNEYGPELIQRPDGSAMINLPKGSSVATASQTAAAMSGGGNTNITLNVYANDTNSIPAIQSAIANSPKIIIEALDQAKRQGYMAQTAGRVSY